MSTLKVNIPKSIGGGFITISVNNYDPDILGSVHIFKQKALEKVKAKKLRTNECGNIFLEPDNFKICIVPEGADLNELAKKHIEDLTDQEFQTALNSKNYIILALFQKCKNNVISKLSFSGIETCHGNGEYLVPLNDAESKIGVGDLSKISQWTISVDNDNSASKVFYLKDYQGLYLTANHHGKVYLQNLKGSWCEWLIEKEGNVSYLLDKHGKYLTCNSEGDVYCCDAKGEWGKFTFSRIILEGPLKRKSGSTIGRQWLGRYFRLHNNTLQCWKNHEEASRCRQNTNGYRSNSNSRISRSKRSTSKYIALPPSISSRRISKSSKKNKNFWNITDIEKVVKVEEGNHALFKIEFKHGIPTLTLEASSDRERDIWVNTLRSEESNQVIPVNLYCTSEEAEANRRKNLELPNSLNFNDLDTPMEISKKEIEKLEPIQATKFITKQRVRTKTLTEQSNEEHNQIVEKLMKEDEKINNLKRIRRESRMNFSKIEEKLQKTMKNCDNNNQNIEILNKIKEEEKKIADLKSKILQSSWAKYYTSYQTYAQKMKTQKRNLEEKQAQEQKNIQREKELKKEEDIADNMEKEIDRQSEILNQRIQTYNKACKSLNDKVSKERENYVQWFREFEIKKNQLAAKWEALPQEETTTSTTSNNVFVTNPVKSAPNTKNNPTSIAVASSNFTPSVPASSIPTKNQTIANNNPVPTTIVHSATKELVIV